MSNWSYCNAILSIHTDRELSNFKELIENILKSAPRITSSEGDCTYLATDFIAGTSLTFPCNKCPYNEDLCGEECNKWDYQTRVMINHYIDRCKIIITCNHGLRDRTKEQTQKEFKQFVKYLRTVFDKCFEVKILCKSIK